MCLSEVEQTSLSLSPRDPGALGGALISLPVPLIFPLILDRSFTALRLFFLFSNLSDFLWQV